LRSTPELRPRLMGYYHDIFLKYNKNIVINK